MTPDAELQQWQDSVRESIADLLDIADSIERKLDIILARLEVSDDGG